MIKELINKYKENKKESERIDKIIDGLDELKWKTSKAKDKLKTLVDEYYSKYEIDKKQIINTNEEYNKNLQTLRQQIEECIKEIEIRRLRANDFYKDNKEDIKLYNKRFDGSLDSDFYQKHLDTKTGAEYLEQYVLNNYIKK